MLFKGAHQAGHDSTDSQPRNKFLRRLQVWLRTPCRCASPSIRPQPHVCFHSLALVISKTHCSTAALLAIGCVEGQMPLLIIDRSVSSLHAPTRPDTELLWRNGRVTTTSSMIPTISSINTLIVEARSSTTAVQQQVVLIVGVVYTMCVMCVRQLEYQSFISEKNCSTLRVRA